MRKRFDILIVDDSIDDCEYYQRLVQTIPKSIYHCTTAGDGRNALKLLLSTKFDCVLLDYSLPGMNGLDVLKSIRTQWPFLPVILLTGHGSELLAAESIKYGANDYLIKPVSNKSRLHAAIMSAINGSAQDRTTTRPKSVSLLVVDDSPDDREMYVRSLNKMSNAAYHIVEASNGMTALERIGSQQFDCVLLDYSIPDMHGLEILKHIRASRPFLAVILLTGHGSEMIAVEAMKEGAYDYFIKSSISPELLHRAIADAVYHSVMQQNIASKDAEIKEKSEALALSEATFRSAIEDASIGMALVATDGRLQKVNKALCDLLGYTEPELLMMDFKSITHPDDLPNVIQYARRAIEGEFKAYQLERRYFRKSGRTVWTSFSVSLVRNASGEPDYFIAQVLDITERKEIERIKSEFISTVSHELRTPLTSIRGSLGLLIGVMRTDMTDNVFRLVNIAHKNSERLILLVNDMLDMDKMASGHMRLDVKEELLAPIILQSVEANQPYADKFRVFISVLPIDPKIKVNVDSARLMQVLANLLSNAAKFSIQEGVIDVAALRVGEIARITVTDRGHGIPEEFRARIFGKFSQADSSDRQTRGGTGLGLHISKQIIEHMSGSIGFETALGKGSSFWIEIPIA